MILPSISVNSYHLKLFNVFILLYHLYSYAVDFAAVVGVASEAIGIGAGEERSTELRAGGEGECRFYTLTWPFEQNHICVSHFTILDSM